MGTVRAHEMRLRPAMLLAAVTVVVFSALFWTSDIHSSATSAHARGLLAVPSDRRRDIMWDTRKIAGLCLSVLVALTSTIDRECGSALYLVLFAVLLDMPLRRAIAFTAFTVACGSLGPAVAAMSEPHVTERGIMALVDYPGALILLPTMFWGLSLGVIANMWAASWLLAVAWVACVTLSNGTLLWSIVRLRFLHSKASLVAHEIVRCDASLLEAVQADGGDVAAAASKPTPAVAAAIEARRAAGKHLRALRDAAEQIEGAALLYPAFHLGSLRGAWEHCLTSSAEGEEHQQAAARGAMPSPPESPRAVLAPAKNQCDTDHAVSRLLLSSTTPADGLAAAHAKRAAAQLADLRTRGTGRFVWRWRDWMHLQSHFELALVLKIVVIHLVTEAFRHAMTKPCTTRFWVTLLGVTGTVTCFLVFVVTSYSGKRLWRGPHWVDALREVRQLQQQAAKRAADGDDITTDDVPAPVAAGEAVAVSMAAAMSGAAPGMKQQGGSGTKTDGQEPCSVLDADAGSAVHDANGKQPAAAAAAAEGSKAPRGRVGGGKQKQRGCGSRLPCRWVPAADAITNLSACNSLDSYSSWTMPRLMVSVIVSFPVGIIATALGLPAGPLMAHLLLWLGLRPHIVSGTSRFLVLNFSVGTFVAYIIAGNLTFQLAAAFALLNVGLAPLGMVLSRAVRMPAMLPLLLSLAMGVSGLIIVTIMQAVPLLAYRIGTSERLPDRLARHAGILSSVEGTGNYFDPARFCGAKAH